MRRLLLKIIPLNTHVCKNLSLITLFYLILFTNSFADNVQCSSEFTNQSISTSVLSSVSLNSGDTSIIYQTHNDRANGQGYLVAISLEVSADPVDVKSVLWKASEINNGHRKFFSINPEVNQGAQGIKLSWANLNKRQKNALRATDTNEMAKKRLDWLLGKTIDGEGKLRKRSHVLGDINGSNTTILNHEKDYGHSILEGQQGKRYASYLKQQSSLKQTIFVGANDGALHAFDALTGEELFAYVPNAILSKIPLISKPNYGCGSMGCLPHQSLVDGKSSVADAYFDDNWHSVLVGTLGLGKKALYALDVSEAEHFKDKNVLWEVSTHGENIDSETYKQHLGFINQEASIVRLKSGRWVVIVGNGSASAKHQAVLFVIDLKTGQLIKALNTQMGSASEPNGLSTPISIDVNDDKNVDRIYAGDQLGNVWRFDLDHFDPEKWSIAFGRKPLFRACEDSACKKPLAITAKLQVGDHPASGVMVYFGTNRSNYEQASSVNSFYAIRDNNSRVLSIKNLVEQKVVLQNSVGPSLEMRVTTDYEVDYNLKQGWMLKLEKDFTQATGERVNAQVLLRESELIIITEVPHGKSCSVYQSRWLMKLDALQGKRLQRITFDTNHDNKLTAEDNIDYERKATIVSGIHLVGSGLTATTPVIFDPANYNQSESILSIQNDGTIKALKTSVTQSSGRVSWRQLR